MNDEGLQALQREGLALGDEAATPPEITTTPVRERTGSEQAVYNVALWLMKRDGDSRDPELELPRTDNQAPARAWELYAEAAADVVALLRPVLDEAAAIAVDAVPTDGEVLATLRAVADCLTLAVDVAKPVGRGGVYPDAATWYRARQKLRADAPAVLERAKQVLQRTPETDVVRWAVVKEVVVHTIPGTGPELGYVVLQGAATFPTSERAMETIRELGLPLGWVAIRLDQLVPDLYAKGPN